MKLIERADVFDEMFVAIDTLQHALFALQKDDVDKAEQLWIEGAKEVVLLKPLLSEFTKNQEKENDNH
ncbi:hypothetical protein [Phocoenobacter skyensis]|uniref:Uncharacterized protein n=1 Tax=Phocoenobacter skyensis TaxID=97481 RepID=A0ABT9JKS1_9PAST|nr:hypothetical protein [Pasteurella skyensis]MDP8079541.1 hypothetical protein [Pasteurella skyensis]MDP8085413.1 hypothetical protein [Pasteurella skyensis]